MGSVYRKRSRGRDLGFYIAFVDIDGVRRHQATHQPSRKDALVFLAEVEGRVRRSLVGVPRPEESAKLTVGDIAQRYLDEYSSPRLKSRERRMADCRTVLNRILPLIGGLRVAELTAARFANARDVLARRLAPNTVRVTIHHIVSVLRWVAREGITKAPLPRVPVPRAVDAVEYLEADEVARLFAAAERRAESGSLRDGSKRVAVMLAVLAGLRRGEIFGLRWCDVDLSTGRLTVARSYRGTPKNGETRHLRLPPALVPVLIEWKQRCPKTAEQVVCPINYQGRWKIAELGGNLGLKRLLHEAGCKPLRRGWHALRHTFASHFVMQGGSVLTLAKILGHASLKVTMVYAHLTPDFLGAEMGRVKF